MNRKHAEYKRVQVFILKRPNSEIFVSKIDVVETSFQKSKLHKCPDSNLSETADSLFRNSSD